MLVSVSNMTVTRHNKSHVIDPDGEVMFFLENANAPFAVWDEKKINKQTPKRPAKKPPKKKLKVDENKVRFLSGGKGRFPLMIFLIMMLKNSKKKKGVHPHKGFC